MNKWGARSLVVRSELDPFLQELVDHILEHVNISLVCGHRNEESQNNSFDAGFSKVRWPDGKHNSLPSKAVDLQPYPYPDNALKLWATLGYIAGIATEYARQRGRTIRWGGDWDQDGTMTDQNFNDLFHLELVDER